MFVITEKVVSGKKVVGFGGFIVNKYLDGNAVYKDKIYITNDLAKYLANNFYLCCFLEGDYTKPSDGIGKFSNFGLVELTEKGNLNFLNDISYLKKRVVLRHYVPARGRLLDIFNAVEDVDCVDVDEWLGSLSDVYGFSQCKDKMVRNMLEHISNSVTHLCRDMFISKGYTVDSYYTSSTEDVAVIEAKTFDESKKYNKILIHVQTLKPYIDSYAVLGFTKDSSEGICLTCEVNDLVLSLYDAMVRTV